MMPSDYYEVKCSRCGGHGVRGVLGNLPPPVECSDCAGGGRLVVYSNDTVAAWPGGPMRGSWPGKYQELAEERDADA